MKTVLYLVLALTFTVSQSMEESLSDATDLTNGELDGNALLQMGVEFKSPLLRLLGKTLKRVEQKNEQAFSELKPKSKLEDSEIISELCRLHPCDDWSEWNSCPFTRWGFGTITRERTCDGNTNFCNSSKKVRIETESKLCENMCPLNYTNGFCLKFVDNMVIKSVAKTSCQSEGGHVVNINSQLKSDAVHEVLKAHGETGTTIWLDGERKSISSPWEYTYQTEQTAFSNWYSTQPSNGSKEFCQLEEVGSGFRYMMDRNCGNTYKYVCEIVFKQ